MSKEIIDSVFDGANTLLNAGQAIAQTAFTAYDAFQNPNAAHEFSRRNAGMMGCQQTGQIPMYQPSAYPWADQPVAGPGNYGFGMQSQTFSTNGYPGITNPNYGVTGFYGVYQSGSWGASPATDSIFGSIGGFRL